MMSGARIVEHGVHDDLMESNNKYATMVKSMISEAERESHDEDDNEASDEENSPLYSDLDETGARLGEEKSDGDKNGAIAGVYKTIRKKFKCKEIKCH